MKNSYAYLVFVLFMAIFFISGNMKDQEEPEYAEIDQAPAFELSMPIDPEKMEKS